MLVCRSCCVGPAVLVLVCWCWFVGPAVLVLLCWSALSSPVVLIRAVVSCCPGWCGCILLSFLTIHGGPSAVKRHKRQNQYCQKKKLIKTDSTHQETRLKRRRRRV
ncbi:MAG: hypothetical protein J3Q66DRAFT_33683 [Benniella sp.]|nr:MAG: hypothetical protein J3Q66DRAFT_33683 [Benniella sp.]